MASVLMPKFPQRQHREIPIFIRIDKTLVHWCRAGALEANVRIQLV